MGLDAELTVAGWVVQPLVSAMNGFTISRILEAQLPNASALNIDTCYQLTDVGDKLVYNFDGVTWTDITSRLDAADLPASLWANRGTGAVGDRKRFTDIGNNPNVVGMFDGSEWQPDGGMQMVYGLKAPTVGASSTSSSVSLTTVSIPAGLMGLNGAIAMDVLVNLDGDPLTVAETVTFGGSTIMSNTATGTSERRYFRREVRNQNSASVQIVTNRASGAEYGSFGPASTQITALALNTATALSLAGSVAFTSTAAQIPTLHLQRVWWIGG